MAQKYREKLVETLAEFDDDIMEAYLSEELIDDDHIHGGYSPGDNRFEAGTGIVWCSA